MLKSSRRRWTNTFPAFDPLQDWLIREEEGRTHHSLFPEVNANCGDELGVELVVCISVKEGGLPHAGVPQGKELYKVVIIPISHSDGHEEHLQERNTLNNSPTTPSLYRGVSSSVCLCVRELWDCGQEGHRDRTWLPGKILTLCVCVGTWRATLCPSKVV